MSLPIYCFDPTISDTQSKVRGIGRYMQILRETYGNTWKFIDTLKSIPFESVFINPFYNLLQPPKIFKRIAKKQICVIHDLIPLKYPQYYPLGIKGNIYVYINKLLLRNYDLIITDSEASKKDIKTILNIPEDKIKIIYPCLPKIFTNSIINVIPAKAGCKSPNGEIYIDSRLRGNDNVGCGNDERQSEDEKVSSYKLQVTSLPFRSSHFIGTKEGYMLYVGDATWNKNLVNLARAIKIANIPCVFVGKVFAQVLNKCHSCESRNLLNQTFSKNSKNNYIDSRLRGNDKVFNVISYDLSHPWQKELKEFLQLAQNDQRFIFPGFISDEELIQLYQNALCNILVSRDEGFGFSFVEAASQNCPSILSDIPIFHEIAQDSVLFVNHENPEAIAKEINNININSTIKQELIKKAKKRVEFFAPESFKLNFRALLKELTYHSVIPA